MGVPVANIVESFVEQPLNLPPLSQAVRQERHQTAAIRRPRPGGTFDLNGITVEAREELTARFTAADTGLAVAQQVLDHGVSEDEGLARVPDGVCDHAARTWRAHTGQEADAGHGRFTVMPPAPGSPISAIQSGAQVLPAASTRLRCPIQM